MRNNAVDNHSWSAWIKQYLAQCSLLPTLSQPAPEALGRNIRVVPSGHCVRAPIQHASAGPETCDQPFGSVATAGFFVLCAIHFKLEKRRVIFVYTQLGTHIYLGSRCIIAGNCTQVNNYEGLIIFITNL